MPQHFRIIEGASVCAPDSILHIGPKLMPTALVEALSSTKAGRSGISALEDAIRNGFVEPLGAVSHLDSGRIAPGVHSSESPPIRADKPGQGRTPESMVVNTSDGIVSSITPPRPDTPPAAPEPVGSTVGWNFSDDAVEGKSLDELNVMIVERLPADERESFEAYETEAEAKAHLQQDRD